MKKKCGFKILLFSSVAIKIMGFFYKLPLANVLGEEMLGIYQLIFPTYSLFLTITSSSFCSAISGRFKELHGDTSGFSKILTVSGLIGTAVLMIIAYPLAYFLGEIRVALCFILISPSIYFVARNVYFKGVSQGMLDFSPTAVSELIEQGVKIAISLPLIFIVKDKYLALLSAVFAITIAEFITVLFLKKKVAIKAVDKKSVGVKGLALHSISFAIFPLCSVIETIIAMKMLCSVSEYGVYSGVALVVCSVPITAISALSTSIIPKVAEKSIRKKTISDALTATLLITVPFVFGLLLYQNEILSLLFPRIEEGRDIAANLIKLCSAIPVCQGVQLITTASLYGKREEKGALIALVLGGVIKIAILIVGGALGFGIKTAPIAATSSFLVAAAVNLVYIIRRKELDFSAKKLAFVLAYTFIVSLSAFFLKRYIDGIGSLFLSVALLGTELLAFCAIMKIGIKTKKGRENNVC